MCYDNVVPEYGSSKEVYTMTRVTKDMLIGDMLKIDITIAAILMAEGMHCVGCPASQGETLEEASFVHGMDVDELVTAINEYLEKKEEQQAKAATTEE